ncbi:hypothetical protein Tco_1092236 [Tanacetum coccineum]|uniref:Reverse transcriptase domain-containing protein n=1 Tax=Tanacetum coccineum TaxID=301880 RepID=A0ABQ5I9E9_9ASTR
MVHLGGVSFIVVELSVPHAKVGKLLHEMQKLESELWNHAMVGVSHVAYTDRFHELAKLVPHLISGALTDEAVRNGSIKKVEKRGSVGEPSKDKNDRDDNKRTRTKNAFATTINPDCRGVPRNMNPVNARNPTVRACYEYGNTNHWLWKPREPGLGIGHSVGSTRSSPGSEHCDGVRIPLPGWQVLRVLGERPKEKTRFFMGAKAGDEKQEEIIMVRDFPEVFPDDLSGLPTIREIEF